MAKDIAGVSRQTVDPIKTLFSELKTSLPVLNAPNLVRHFCSAASRQHNNKVIGS